MGQAPGSAQPPPPAPMAPTVSQPPTVQPPAPIGQPPPMQPPQTITTSHGAPNMPQPGQSAAQLAPGLMKKPGQGS